MLSSKEPCGQTCTNPYRHSETIPYLLQDLLVLFPEFMQLFLHLLSCLHQKFGVCVFNTGHTDGFSCPRLGPGIWRDYRRLGHSLAIANMKNALIFGTPSWPGWMLIFHRHPTLLLFAVWNLKKEKWATSLDVFEDHLSTYPSIHPPFSQPLRPMYPRPESDGSLPCCSPHQVVQWQAGNWLFALLAPNPCATINGLTLYYVLSICLITLQLHTQRLKDK